MSTRASISPFRGTTIDDENMKDRRRASNGEPEVTVITGTSILTSSIVTTIPPISAAIPTAHGVYPGIVPRMLRGSGCECLTALSCRRFQRVAAQPESSPPAVGLSCGRRELQRQSPARRVRPRCRWSKNSNQVTRALLRFVIYFER